MSNKKQQRKTHTQGTLPITVDVLKTEQVDRFGHREFLADGSYNPWFCPQTATTVIIKP